MYTSLCLGKKSSGKAAGIATGSERQGVPEGPAIHRVARYLDHGKADHYAHAEVYCHQALAWEGARFLF